MPNRVTNLYASAQTVRPYSPGEIVGDTTPTLPDPPPPPQGRAGCGGFGQVLVMVVSIAVAIAVPAMAPALKGLTGTLVGAAVGNVAGQVVGNIAGVQKGFNFCSLAMSVASAGIGHGIFGGGAPGAKTLADRLLPGSLATGFTGAAFNAAAGSLLGQGAAILVGAQQRFDWRAVAAAAAGGAASAAPGSTALGPVGTRVAGGMITQAIANRGRVNFAQVAGDVFGNLLGHALAGQIYEGREQQLAAREDAREAAMWQAVGGGAAPSQQSPAAARPPESSWRMMASSGAPVIDAAAGVLRIGMPNGAADPEADRIAHENRVNDAVDRILRRSPGTDPALAREVAESFIWERSDPASSSPPPQTRVSWYIEEQPSSVAGQYLERLEGSRQNAVGFWSEQGSVAGPVGRIFANTGYSLLQTATATVGLVADSTFRDQALLGFKEGVREVVNTRGGVLIDAARTYWDTRSAGGMAEDFASLWLGNLAMAPLVGFRASSGMARLTGDTSSPEFVGPLPRAASAANSAYGPIFKGLLSDIRRADFSTASNGAVFWTGYREGNQARAMQWAAANGKSTIEMTPGGKWLTSLDLYGPNSPVSIGEADNLWSEPPRISRRLAGLSHATTEVA